MTLNCRARLTPSQWHWLSATTAKFRRISFHRKDDGSVLLLFDNTMLVS